jgi:hypothetical protein
MNAQRIPFWNMQCRPPSIDPFPYLVERTLHSCKSLWKSLYIQGTYSRMLVFENKFQSPCWNLFVYSIFKSCLCCISSHGFKSLSGRVLKPWENRQNTWLMSMRGGWVDDMLSDLFNGFWHCLGIMHNQNLTNVSSTWNSSTFSNRHTIAQHARKVYLRYSLKAGRTKRS